jgi:hypothetical protein
MGIPILGICFVLYTIYKNVVGVTGAYVYFPYFVLAWLLIGFAIVTAVPGVIGRVRAQLEKNTQTTTEGAQS